MQNTSNVLEDIEAIIARAMAEVGETSDEETPSSSEPSHPADWEIASPVEDPAIPQRVNSVVVNEATSRFSGAIWYEKVQNQRVILAGVGGIGSYIAFLLGRLNLDNLVLYDDDIVETANMSGQLYGRNNIGEYKVNAIGSFIRQYTELGNIICLNEKFTSDSCAGPIMICGFDNMEARKTFFQSWVLFLAGLSDSERAKCLFIDGRLAAEEFQVLCIKGDDEFSINRYRKDYLFTDGEADATICSYKQTTFMANMIGSIICNLFVNFIANQCDPLIPRDLPFFTEYNAETMFFKAIA